MNHRISLAAALLAATCFTASCSDSAAASISGSYSIDVDKTMEAATVGKSETEKAELALMKPLMTGATLELKEDMTFVCTHSTAMSKATMKGTWLVTEGKITFNQTHHNDTEEAKTHNGSITDNVITCEMEDAGKKMTYVFNKDTK